jgi:membrane protein
MAVDQPNSLCYSKSAVIWDILYDAAMGWIDDEAMTRGAAIAFYTIFALAPFVILVTAVAGLVIGREAAQGALMDEIGQLIGGDAVMTLQSLATSASDTRAGAVASLFGISTILVGATTVFAELHTSLNRIWKAKPPDNSPVTWLVKVRLKGLALIGVIGFLLRAYPSRAVCSQTIIPHANWSMAS